MSSDQPGAAGGPPTGVGFYFNADDTWNVSPSPPEWIEIAPNVPAPEAPQRRRLPVGWIALGLALAAAASMALAWSLTPPDRPAPSAEPATPPPTPAPIAPATLAPPTPTPAVPAPVTAAQTTPAPLPAPVTPAQAAPAPPAKPAASAAAKPAPHRARPTERRSAHATRHVRRPHAAAKHPPASRKASRPPSRKPAAPAREPPATAPRGFPYAAPNPG